MDISGKFFIQCEENQDFESKIHLLWWRIWPRGLMREQTQLSIKLPLWIWWQYVFYLYNIEALWANGDESGDGCWETCVTEYF